jgi:hypothetical protein
MALTQREADIQVRRSLELSWQPAGSAAATQRCISINNSTGNE